MYCPSCSAQNSVEQKFCRSCGMNLEMSVTSLLEQFPNGERVDLQRQEKRLEKFGTIVFTGFGVVCSAAVIGIIYAIFDAFILGGENVVAGVIFILFLLFAALGLTYVVINENLKEKKLAARNPNVEPLLKGVGTGKLLEEGHFEPVPSVTEGTTELLGIKRKTRELDG